MIEALKNPQFKKTWEEINWKVRHPEAKSLYSALAREKECRSSYGIVMRRASHQYGQLRMFRDMYQVDRYCAKEAPEIIGRPITLENILMLLAKNGKSHNEIGVVLCENGNLYIKPGTSGKYDFEWECSKHLHEQSEETWETTSEFINQKKEFKI